MRTSSSFSSSHAKLSTGYAIMAYSVDDASGEIGFDINGNDDKSMMVQKGKKALSDELGQKIAGGSFKIVHVDWD